jgi:hypothetical protein
MALESLQKGVNGTEGPTQETVVIHYFSQKLIRFRVSSIIPVMGEWLHFSPSVVSLWESAQQISGRTLFLSKPGVCRKGRIEGVDLRAIRMIQSTSHVWEGYHVHISQSLTGCVEQGSANLSLVSARYRHPHRLMVDSRPHTYRRSRAIG